MVESLGLGSFQNTGQLQGFAGSQRRWSKFRRRLRRRWLGDGRPGKWAARHGCFGAMGGMGGINGGFGNGALGRGGIGGFNQASTTMANNRQQPLRSRNEHRKAVQLGRYSSSRSQLRADGKLSEEMLNKLLERGRATIQISVIRRNNQIVVRTADPKNNGTTRRFDSRAWTCQLHLCFSKSKYSECNLAMDLTPHSTTSSALSRTRQVSSSLPAQQITRL